MKIKFPGSGCSVHSTPAVVISGKVVHAGGLPSQGEVQASLTPRPIGFLSVPTRHLFFTGKGGVGKTSLSTATTLTPADAERSTVREQLSDACTHRTNLAADELAQTGSNLTRLIYCTPKRLSHAMANDV